MEGRTATHRDRQQATPADRSFRGCLHCFRGAEQTSLRAGVQNVPTEIYAEIEACVSQ